MSLIEDIKKEDAGVSLLEELESAPEESGEYTESEQWRPEPGDGIEGVVIETFSFRSKYPDQKTGVKHMIPGLVLQVDGDDTPWSVVGLHGFLRGEIEKAEPAVGDRVAVIYTGKRPTKDGEFEFHHYRFAIRRGNGSVKPVPAQRVESNNGAGKAAGSTQHEAVKKPATTRRKPGATKAAVSDDPDF
jgi:hypothetical protein